MLGNETEEVVITQSIQKAIYPQSMHKPIHPETNQSTIYPETLKYTKNNVLATKGIMPFNISKIIADIKDLKNKNAVSMENIDDFFLVAMGILVFFMQTGFAFLEAGSVR